MLRKKDFFRGQGDDAGQTLGQVDHWRGDHVSEKVVQHCDVSLYHSHDLCVRMAQQGAANITVYDDTTLAMLTEIRILLNAVEKLRCCMAIYDH